MKGGKLISFSAPSGAGKTTIVKHLLQTRPDLAFSISATTRKIREGEQDGRDYYFLSKEEFENKIAENAFVEYEEVYPGTYYGTLKSELERIWAEGKHVVFDLDVKGGLSLKRLFSDNLLDIFIKPPSLEKLKERLTTRGTESDEQVQMRVNKASDELKYEHLFSTVLLNDDLNKTLIQADFLVDEFIKK